MKSTIRRSILLFLLLVPTSYLQAQSSLKNALISGQLTDASGYGLPSAQVIATRDGADSTPTYQGASTTDGTYSLTLPPGTYHVRFEHAAFITRELTLQLAPGES